MKKQIIKTYTILLMMSFSASWANDYKKNSSPIITGQYLSCDSLKVEIQKTQTIIDNIKNTKTKDSSLARKMQLNKEERNLKNLKNIEISQNCY